jgi:hypothetical protein
MLQLIVDTEGKDPDPEKGRVAVGKIVLEMRKDLLGKTNLAPKEFRYIDVIE